MKHTYVQPKVAVVVGRPTIEGRCDIVRVIFGYRLLDNSHTPRIDLNTRKYNERLQLKEIKKISTMKNTLSCRSL